MLGGDDLTFFCGGGDERSPGQVISSAEEPAGTLMDGGDGLFGERVCFTPAIFRW
jgi:hypothetical protein